MKKNTGILLLISAMLMLVSSVSAQQAGATGEPLVVDTPTVPKAFLRQSYHFQLQGHGGITPLTWRISDGTLPDGIALTPDGTLAGVPTASGEFHFTVVLTDSGKPAHEKSQPIGMAVVAPLFAQWSHLPAVSGQKVSGAIKVSNATEQDFDLTVIIVAINEIERATALGYQHFQLKRGTTDLEIPFVENLPFGNYLVNVDVVGEVPQDGKIYRTRLVGNGKIQVKQGP